MAELCSTDCITLDDIPSLRPCKGRFITGSFTALIMFKCNMGFNQEVDLGGESSITLEDIVTPAQWTAAADAGLIAYYLGVGTFPEPEETTIKTQSGKPEAPHKWTYSFEFIINRFIDKTYTFAEELDETVAVRNLKNYEAYTVGFVLPDKRTVVLSDEAVTGGTGNPGFSYVGVPSIVYGEDDTTVVAIKIKGGFDYTEPTLKMLDMPNILTLIKGA